MRCLLRVHSEAMMSLMLGALGTHEHASGAEGHRTRGTFKALPYREVGLEPQDTWQYRSPAGRWSWCLGHVVTSEPSRAGDGSGAARHVMTLKPSPTGWRARCHGAHGDAGALRTGRRVWSRGTRGDTRALS
jgi:hypothetical protein